MRSAGREDEADPTPEQRARWGANARLLAERLRPDAVDEPAPTVALSHEAEYAFDVAGHLRLRGLLSVAELTKLNGAISHGPDGR
jgi:hypothetical protein